MIRFTILAMIKVLKQLLDWIYHKNCYLCRKKADLGLICQSCFENLDINSPDSLRVVDGVNVYYSGIYTDNLRKLIRGLKYHNKKELALPLAKILFAFWSELELSKENFEIVPMPLYSDRERERGYNHVTLVAQELSKLTGYPVNTEIVKRVKNTKPQYKLSRLERKENLKSAFQVYPEKYNGKKLLLIDDICTSGTTFEELIKTFKKHNLNNLYGLTSAVPVNSSLYQN